jgi:Cu(I)/Ag(I) efflux system membrane fusion protein
MNFLKANIRLLLVAAVMLVIGLLIGRLGHSGHSHKPAPEATSQSGQATVWTCSMDPQVRQPDPGKCPICGMDLIPLEDDNDEGDALVVKMSANAVQLANVRTALVESGNAVRELRLNGKVQADERLKYSQVTHISGRVEKLSINFTGEPVHKGQKLASLYSPELVTAQEELFAAQKIQDIQPGLLEAARQKLRNWKLSDAQINEILAEGKVRESFPILADVSGIVLEKRVQLGDYLSRGMPLYDIVDLSNVWVLFDVYESDMLWVKVGSAISFTVQSLPGQQFEGRISFIDPVINPVSRVATARVELRNSKGKLKPEMFATGILKSSLGKQGEGLLVPRSAVLWTGERSIVYVKQASDTGFRFQMRPITLGALTQNGYLVLEGLEAGEEIAVSGTFSIDAAAQLAGKPSMMNPGEPEIEKLEISPKARNIVSEVFGLYFQLKDALVASNLQEARKHGSQLAKLLHADMDQQFSGEAADFWKQHRQAAEKHLQSLLKAADLEGARAAFKPLSEHLIALANAFGPFEQTFYIQHCPMADKDAGADWLSLQKEIRNPYFGEQMLKCGTVKQTISETD